MLPTSFPIPVLPRPDSVPSLGWGILAPGSIAATFAEGVLKHTNQRIVAVGSRNAARSAEFAQRFSIENAFDSYEHVVDDPAVDVVYVAAPQHVHRDLALLAIRAGKHVLIEKPIALTGAEAREIAAAATTAGVLVMEAMWSRYLPQSYVIRQLLTDGVLGDIRLVSADHGQSLSQHPRLSSPATGGGALLDLGVYPVAFASAVLGKPAEILVQGSLLDGGVDAQSVLSLRYADPHAQSNLSTSLVARTPTAASIAGSEALLVLESPFFVPTRLSLSTPEFLGDSIRWEDRSGITGHNGLSYQATALADYVAQGFRESPLHTLQETVEIMDTIDTARHALGYRFESER